MLTAASNRVAVANASITTTTLGLGALEAPGRDALINWLRGADIDDENADGATTDARLAMGDPMHGRPATVIYGGTVSAPDPFDGVIFAVNNDGYLHAINAVDGSELWAFIPQQMLARMRDLHLNDAVPARDYGLDGNIRVIKNEVNDNGVLESSLGERVYIYFGMRRGGSEYYGLDVTDRNAPTLLWKIGPNEAGLKRTPNAGQSWSTPTVARVNVSVRDAEHACSRFWCSAVAMTPCRTTARMPRTRTATRSSWWMPSAATGSGMPVRAPIRVPICGTRP